MKFITQQYIGGQWLDGEGGQTFPVINPANMNELAHVAYSSKKHTLQAIQAASLAFKTWARTTGKERARILRQLHQQMLHHRDEMARIITLENGKILAESYAEVDYATNFVEWFAEEAKRIYGEIVPALSPAQQLFVTKEPVGVVAAITPWNFPLAMLARKVSPALAAGCTVVVKPANETPLSALFFMKLCENAGVPSGVVNTVCGDTPIIGEVLTAATEVRMLTFTGSTKVGKMLMAKASSTVKKVALELGGNAPFIVFEDASLDQALEGLVASKLRNGGQSCICANRIFVARSILTEFTKRLEERFTSIKVGDGLDSSCHLGPMISAAAVRRMQTLVQGALSHNAEVLFTGEIGSQLAQSPCFMAPTILVNTTLGLEIEQTEIFGPIISIFPFDEEEEVVSRANNSNYGLASYFYSEDKARIWRVARNLEYGMVGINNVALSSEMACFGGVKESGLGREGGREGILEYLEPKFMVMS